MLPLRDMSGSSNDNILGMLYCWCPALMADGVRKYAQFQRTLSTFISRQQTCLQIANAWFHLVSLFLFADDWLMR